MVANFVLLYYNSCYKRSFDVLCIEIIVNVQNWSFPSNFFVKDFRLSKQKVGHTPNNIPVKFRSLSCPVDSPACDRRAQGAGWPRPPCHCPRCLRWGWSWRCCRASAASLARWGSPRRRRRRSPQPRPPWQSTVVLRMNLSKFVFGG